MIGVPDEKWGEAVKAVVQLKTGARASEAEIIQLVKRQLGSGHAPKSVQFVESLPRSPNGKVLKCEIRDELWKGVQRRVG